MKNKFFLVLALIFFCPFLDFAQVNSKEDSFSKDFERVAGVFEKNVKPYLLQFAEKQFKSEPNSEALNHRVDSRYRIYLQQAEQLREESYAELLKGVKNGDKKFDKAFLIGYFDFAYRNRFAGLDYKFFENCAKELN